MNASHIKVAVVTATIGHRQLHRALRSVQQQTHASIEHWVVVDGPEGEASVRASVASVRGQGGEPSVTVLSYRTGMDGWCSHRIYAAAPFLVNAEFVCFLDQDNWFDPTHVELLLKQALRQDSPVAHSLRKIYTQEGEFVCRDDCQSLGPLHDSFDHPGMRHIDTNCWLVHRALAMDAAKHWCVQDVGDRSFAREMMQRYPDLPCTLEHSLNYCVESRAESARAGYFLQGNEVMRRRYPGGLPWLSR